MSVIILHGLGRNRFKNERITVKRFILFSRLEHRVFEPQLISRLRITQNKKIEHNHFIAYILHEEKNVRNKMRHN